MKNYDLTNDSQQERMRPSEIERLIQSALNLQVTPDMDVPAAKALLDSAMNELAIACSAIQSQIDQANQRRWEEGQFSDSDWYRRVHGALRSKKWARQQLQNKIGLVNRQLRSQNALKHDKTREQLFIEISREHLPKETFLHFWQLVDERTRHG